MAFINPEDFSDIKISQCTLTIVVCNFMRSRCSIKSPRYVAMAWLLELWDFLWATTVELFFDDWTFEIIAALSRCWRNSERTFLIFLC